MFNNALYDKMYFICDHDFCLIWCFKYNYLNFFDRWLFILKMFISNLAFALSCVGNKPPQAIMLMVARCQNFAQSDFFFFTKNLYFFAQWFI